MSIVAMWLVRAKSRK